MHTLPPKKECVKLRTPRCCCFISQDIETSHKLNTKGNKPTIVKFISHKLKSNLYSARAKLKNIKVSNVFPGLGYSASVESERIFVNENLNIVSQENHEQGKRKTSEL